MERYRSTAGEIPADNAQNASPKGPAPPLVDVGSGVAVIITLVGSSARPLGAEHHALRSGIGCRPALRGGCSHRVPFLESGRAGSERASHAPQAHP